MHKICQNKIIKNENICHTCWTVELTINIGVSHGDNECALVGPCAGQRVGTLVVACVRAIVGVMVGNWYGNNCDAKLMVTRVWMYVEMTHCLVFGLVIAMDGDCN